MTRTEECEAMKAYRRHSDRFDIVDGRWTTKDTDVRWKWRLQSWFTCLTFNWLNQRLQQHHQQPAQCVLLLSVVNLYSSVINNIVIQCTFVFTDPHNSFICCWADTKPFCGKDKYNFNQQTPVKTRLQQASGLNTQQALDQRYKLTCQHYRFFSTDVRASSTV